MTRILTVFAALAVALFLSAGSAEADTKGTFTGASNHVTKGTASIEKSGSGYVVKLHGDFWFDGAPDPWVSLGKGKRLNAAQLGVLRENSGEQVYKIPAGIDPAEFDQIVIFCVKYTVPLGIAKIQ